jgi:hypothetical protein
MSHARTLDTADIYARRNGGIRAVLDGDERSQVADALARIEQAIEQGDDTGWGDVVRTKLVTARSLLVEALGPEPEAPPRKKF